MCYKTRLNRTHYTMASMLGFLADEPICSQAENLQDPKTVSIIISNMCTPLSVSKKNISKGEGVGFMITKQQQT